MENTVLGIGSRVSHPEFGKGVIVNVTSEKFVITFIEHGIREILRTFPNLEIIDVADPSGDLISLQDVEETLLKILRKWSDLQEVVPLADKWRGGKLAFQPADVTKKGYEMMIDIFFHKIVMVRDRIRVMEQKINSSKLGDDEKVDLQQYITRIYGSLTSFNVLFKNKDDNFVGSGRDE